ncbi:putative quinol monooxygenase [Arthrobacter sp. Soil763]|uniref:putative quinol monooxygenase n=1 Tax=Arthrobacter sp. Soil763 TaxID=1736402 RepID=UPI0006F93B36|nr:putative quinol monooxygenase [Arthrobacter sp. Soil763]KRE81794.1 antibiotic biosynthesis monooxygenase [Arthrobacter sp. Soil763]
MPLALYAEFTAKPGTEDRVADMMAELTERVRAEPGNVVFDPHTRRDNPRAYFVYEIYRDEAAFQAHITAEHSKAFNAELGGLIEEDGSQLSWLAPAAGTAPQHSPA